MRSSIDILLEGMSLWRSHCKELGIKKLLSGRRSRRALPPFHWLPGMGSRYQTVQYLHLFFREWWKKAVECSMIPPFPDIPSTARSERFPPAVLFGYLRLKRFDQRSWCHPTDQAILVLGFQDLDHYFWRLPSVLEHGRLLDHIRDGILVLGHFGRKYGLQELMSALPDPTVRQIQDPFKGPYISFVGSL